MRKTIFRKLEAQGLIANYNRLRKNLPPRLLDRVFIWDETLIEGALSPTSSLTYVEKVKLAKMLDEIGVAVVSMGYPGASDEDKNNVRRLANEGYQQVSLAAFAHPSKVEIDACLEAGVHEIAIITPYNGLNLEYRLKKSKDQVLAETVESVQYAKKRNVKVDFVLEDASRTPIEDIVSIFAAVAKAGGDRLDLSDSLGFLRPLSMRYFVSHVREGLEQAKVKLPMSVHCNNDFGLATANTLAAAEEGVEYLHTCVAGFGERSGTAPLEEVVTALELLYDVDTGVDLNKIYRVAQLAEKTFALPLQFHKPLIGDNSFLLELNQKTEGVNEQPILYEPFPPEIIGREAQFYVGRQARKNLIEGRLIQAGIRASPMQIDEIMRRLKRIHESADKGEAQMTFYQIKKLMRDLRRGLSDEDFWRTVEDVTRQKPKLPQKEQSPP